MHRRRRLTVYEVPPFTSVLHLPFRNGISQVVGKVFGKEGELLGSDGKQVLAALDISRRFDVVEQRDGKEHGIVDCKREKFGYLVWRHAQISLTDAVSAEFGVWLLIHACAKQSLVIER